MTDWTEGLQHWRGKVALITGATGGIGAAMAQALSEQGMKLALAGRREDALADVARPLEAAGAEVATFPVDLRDEVALPALVQAVRERFGGLHVLVNNAGLGHMVSTREARTEQWREMLEVNVLALTVCTREALHVMEEQGEGAILNISSVAAHKPLGYRKVGYYGASKYAVRAFTESLREELVEAGSPIKLSLISPGLVRTGFHGKANPEQGGGSFYGDYQPLDPADVVQAALYILSTAPHVQVNDIVLRPIHQPH